MASGMNPILYPVKNAAQATALYRTLLGVDPYVETPYYVGLRVGEQEIGLVPNGHDNGMSGPIAYWNVDDIHAHLARLVEAGAEVQQPVMDVGAGLLVASVRDADGNVTGLRQEP